MQTYIVLIGSGGELDREMIVMPDGEMTLRELGQLIDWIIKPGDTIRVIEKE